MRKHRWLPYVLAAVIIAACYGGIELSQFVLDDYRNEVEEITAALKAAGFSKVECTHHKKNPWIAIVATK